jgi:phosphate transport system protein
MSVHLQREIDRLKKSLLSLCALVEDQVQTAVHALLERDAQTARSVEQQDAEIDSREVDVEEDCLKILALHQPVAADLRFIVSALKINNDLERIGDLAVNIARKVKTLAAEPAVELPFDLAGMSEKTQLMLHDSLEALVNLDSRLADSVCAQDDEVDRMKHTIRHWAEDAIRTNVDRAPALLALLSATRNLERIADHATNIAEDVVYMVEGKIIRHGMEEAGV